MLNHRFYAILPAAGDGNRMGELAKNTSKVLLQLIDNQTVLEMTLRALCSSGVLSGLVIVAREEDIPSISDLAKSCCSNLEIIIVKGGVTRQDSVSAGILAIEGKADFVLVHDAARPFCSKELIAKIVESVKTMRACIAAVPVKASLKRVIADGTISQTIKRADVWEAQTPQAFAYDLLKTAHDKARQDKYLGTDESELVERMGHPVRVIPGEDSNIKITTPHDFEYAIKYLNK
jgi:2-C-methyl-D-erythritol 4-phosphate cytidylyltransferase